MRSTYSYMSTCSCSARLLAEGEIAHPRKKGNATACANPPTTTLVSMGADMRGDEGAVSYTHLTLPTILRV